MIVLVTDFGLEGPYVGQVLRVLHGIAPAEPVVNLFADAPAWNPRATAYLIAAYSGGFPADTIFICIVDPGVGTASHPPVVTRCDEHWFVGPDNGLFEIVRRRAGNCQTWRIDWQPRSLSASFHGRDLYAPVAARLAIGDRSGLTESPATSFPGYPDQLPEVIYVDHYGNAISGLQQGAVPSNATLRSGEHRFRPARTFADVQPGEGFWYVNSNGLIEIAANRARAAEIFGLSVGTAIELE